MARSRRVRAAMALMATPILLLPSACNKEQAPTEGGLYKNPVTLTWWHNAAEEGPGKVFWQKVATDFHNAHPTVTIEIEAIETNQLQRTRIPAALLSNDPPDIFQAWGGGEIVDQVKSDSLKDITEQTKAEVASIGSASAIWAVDGKQYGLPFRMGIEGFWYNKKLFADAGITAPPKTLDELKTTVTKLKGSNVVPISVGAGDKWPAAHYWYNFALRACSVDALKAATLSLKFDDPCFVKAGTDLKDFIGVQPFQPNFIATASQQGAGSSAGLVASGKAAMELMGDWNFGVMQRLAGDTWNTMKPNIGWFPFPSITGPGDPKAALGGGDGYACSKKAPAECVEFLKYIVSPAVQKAYAEVGVGLPVAKGASDGVSEPVLKSILEATNGASYVQLWLDTAYGSTVGTAMNDGIIAIFAGSGTPQKVVDDMKSAAKK